MTGRTDKLSDASLFPVDEVFAKELNSLDANAFVENVDRYYAENGGHEVASVSTVGGKNICLKLGQN